jgi:hypothetical protein
VSSGPPHLDRHATHAGTASGALTWTVSGGALPANLTLSTGGRISGTPTVVGTFTVTRGLPTLVAAAP